MQSREPSLLFYCFSETFSFSRILPVKSEAKSLTDRIDCESLLLNWCPPNFLMKNKEINRLEIGNFQIVLFFLEFF